MLLAILLPVQGVALVLDQAWRPAHYHRHVSVPVGPAIAPGMLRDDTVLAYLLDGPRTGADKQDAGDAAGASSLRAQHHGIGHHLHAFNDPDVVYVDDDGQPGESPRHLSNGMVMLAPQWPSLMVPMRTGSYLPGILLAYQSHSAHPLDRPPR